MSDKVRWVGSGTVDIAPRPPLIDRYVMAKVHVNGSTHIGLMVESVCYQLCNNTAKNPILMPVMDGEVDCQQCRHIMRRDGIGINMSVKYENKG